MKFKPKFTQGLFVKRYKRFLADVLCEDGSTLTIHCPNTGSMRFCQEPNTPCWWSISDNPKRKYPHTLEIVTTQSGHRAGINTSRSNALVAEAIESNRVVELANYQTLKAEMKSPIDNSRIDFLLSDHTQDSRPCFVEVKNVTLLEHNNQGFFPDAVSERGAKHLRTLTELLDHGYRCVLFFCVQHTGIKSVSPADHIDPTYGRLLREAAAAGVEIIAYTGKVTATEISLTKSLPVIY